jgi:NAD(P)-dependent dehydrogenase (short-subunit alcohol dehydrogenase family)
MSRDAGEICRRRGAAVVPARERFPLPGELSMVRLSALAMGLWTLLALGACGAPPEPEDAAGTGSDGVTRDAPVILITGSTGGLGREVALEMASQGAHIIVHGRSEERGREVVAAIEAEGGGTAEFHAADLASLDAVRAFAEEIRSRHDRIDVLVNNAGIWLEPDQGRLLSEDGHELHLQVNYLSHFLLTRELLPLLRAAGTHERPARIINVSSVAQRPIEFDDVGMEEGYSDGRGYAQSKLAQIFHTFDLAEELEGEPILALALHPATMMDTGMVLSRGAQARASVDEGREAVVNLITAPGLESGQYFNGLTPARANDQAYDEEARERLRALSLEWIDEG